MPINRVTIVGNLTREPELRALPLGGNVCSLRVAVNERKKDQAGQWVDAPNFFNVTVFGGSADNCAKFLFKGSQAAVDGRLRWREWQDQQGNKRESIEIVAQDVQFIGGREEMTGPQARQAAQNGGRLPQADQAYPVEQSDFGNQGAGGFDAPPAAQTGPFSDNEIPF